MDGHQLRCFLAIAELGSLTRAAGRLDIAQPTLSQILLRLEDELGIKLFERTARGVNLTDPGRIFQEHARVILRDMDRARAEVQWHDTAAPATVAIGLPSSISNLVGARLVVAARGRLPNVSVQLDEAFSGHIRAWLAEDAPRRRPLDHREGQAADREHLVRPHAPVHLAGDMVHIHHVDQPARLGVGEAGGEGCARLPLRRFPPRRPGGADAKRVIHSACTSTGLPTRGVTTQSPSFASIQVSCTPGSPARSNPSVSATMP